MKCLTAEEEYIRFRYRCTKKEGYCKQCAIHRRNLYFSKMMRRYEATSEAIKRLSLWTIGTFLVDSEPNRILMEEYWQLFRKVMNKNTDWNPLTRVLEIGPRGRRLHLHILVMGYASRKFVRAEWSRITKTAMPNVDLREIKSYTDNIVRILWYAAKYVSKSSAKYSWLGLWYGKYTREKSKDSKQCAHYRFWVIKEYYDDHQTVLDPNFIKEEIRFDYGRGVWVVKYKNEQTTKVRKNDP